MATKKQTAKVGKVMSEAKMPKPKMMKKAGRGR